MSRTAPKIAHLHNIYTSTYGILFFGTPHLGSHKAHLASTLQKLASLSSPRAVLDTSSSLLAALEENSETLQNITDQFAPLLARFRIFFFWEQERTDLKYTRDYIVEEASAAPILDDTERSGIAADHRGMCKFADRNAPGFTTVVAALRRYVAEAPAVVRGRTRRAGDVLREQGWADAEELVRGLPPGWEVRRGLDGYGRVALDDNDDGRLQRREREKGYQQQQLENAVAGRRAVDSDLEERCVRLV